MQDDRQQKPGCGLTPGAMIAIALAFIWMAVVVPAYQRWRYPDRPAEETPAAKDAEEEARRAKIEKLRATAKAVRDAGNVEAAEILEAAIARLEKGEDPLASPTRVTPAEAREATGAAAGKIVEAVGPPGSATANGLAAAAQKLRGGASTGEPTGPGEAEKPPPEEPEPEPTTLTVLTDGLEIDFSTRGASVERARSLKYFREPGDEKEENRLDILLPLRGPRAPANSFILRTREGSEFQADLARRVWHLAGDTDWVDQDAHGRRARRISFRTVVKGVKFTKTYVLHRLKRLPEESDESFAARKEDPGSRFLFDVELEVRNTGQASTKEIALDFVGPNGIAPDDVPGRYCRIGAALAGEPGGSFSVRSYDASSIAKSDLDERSSSPRQQEEGGTRYACRWVALKNRYFAAVLDVRDSEAVQAMYVESLVLEGNVRLMMVDMALDPSSVADYREQANTDPTAAEAVRRWDEDVRPKNADQFAFRRTGFLFWSKRKLFSADAGREAQGWEVKLKSPRDLPKRQDYPDLAAEQDYSADAATGQPNMAVAMRLKIEDIAPGESKKFAFTSYLGPLQSDCMGEEGGLRGWHSLIEFSSASWLKFLSWLSKLLLVLLKVFHFFTKHLGWVIGGYGLAILFLTVTVKGALHPLQRKGMVSMHKMQKLAPEIKAIRKKYEKDKSVEGRRKMQLETMEFYKKHGVSPLGGCLPMLVQLPMFIALFGMLRGAFELRHERYLWISDLTHPDELITFGFSMPLIGNAINLLPFLYLGLMLVQQHLQPKSEDPEVRKQQNMMKFMMIFFFFIFYNMPAALVLYFVFSSGFGSLEQWYIRKYIVPAAETAGPAAPSAGPTAGYVPPTAWDKDAERQAREAEKRKRRKERQRPGQM
ncbi:MAG: membrane protein insertase YidC [Planctomycetota bacterium]|jgi:YidC/Oxa1 family membrane protein insertase